MPSEAASASAFPRAVRPQPNFARVPARTRFLMPSLTTESLDLIRRRHPEWREHHHRWRWLLDSLEGGERYRQAIYGYDAAACRSAT